MTHPNANQTPDDREVNRLRWLLREAAGTAGIQVTMGVIDAVAKALHTALRDNEMVLVRMSDFERDMADEHQD